MGASLQAARAAADETLCKSLVDQESRLKGDKLNELDGLAREHAEVVAALTTLHVPLADFARVSNSSSRRSGSSSSSNNSNSSS